MMTARAFTGWSMLGIVFAAMFAAVAHQLGPTVAACIFLLAFLLTGWIVVAVNLLDD